MPGFDGTGPMGQGPRGRGLGPCGAGRRGSAFGYGRGFRGSGNFPGGWNRPLWGWSANRGNYGPPPSGRGYLNQENEVQALKQEASYLQNELEAIQKRLTELEGA